VIVAFVEDAQDELSRQAITFARGLDEDVVAVAGQEPYAPAAWAAGLVEMIGERTPAGVIAPGTDRGNEVLAHVAAQLDQPLATNCIAATTGDPENGGEPATVTRQRWGGSVLEEARLHGKPLLMTVAPHAVATAEPAEVTPLSVSVNGAPRVAERLQAASAGVSLADADVVVSGGRGVGSAEGFAAIEELADLLGAAVGCSRAVTMAGWRPHTDQVGQTGTKISPEIYIACGISGATQHMAGCKGAKKLLAINPDGEAPIFASADYGVIGDLHEVVPAISNEIRKARGR
jgi:electron transfer flavoprotein alpha subunit